jgi:transcriptional regulator with XRE-family HTH domain
MLEGMIRDDEERKRIGNVIQVLRVQQGLTVDELAKKAGVGSSLLARVELGKFNVRLDVLSSVAEALGYKVDFVKKD